MVARAFVCLCVLVGLFVCVFVLVCVLVFVFGSPFVASISISIAVFAVGPTLLLLLLFDSFRSNAGNFLLLFCLL